jgi:hypothetical protein
MELFKNIRLRIGHTILKRKVADSKRKLYFSNFGQVKKIGVIWDASNVNEFSCLSRFYQNMHERKIEVSILGYYPGRDLPDQYTAIRYLTCLKREDLNFFYQPVSSEAGSFIRNRFDIVIDINFKKHFPLLFISTLSNSAFKVGLFEPETLNSPYDLMIDLKDPVDVEDYLFQVIKYLEMINSDQVKQLINS